MQCLLISGGTSGHNHTIAGGCQADIKHTLSAIRAYRHYLGLRHDPGPAVRPEVERVGRELGLLTGAPRAQAR